MIYDYLEVPDFLSSDATIRKRSEDIVEQMRTSPKLKVDTGGFGGGGNAKIRKRRKARDKATKLDMSTLLIITTSFLYYYMWCSGTTVIMHYNYPGVMNWYRTLRVI